MQEMKHVAETFHVGPKTFNVTHYVKMSLVEMHKIASSIRLCVRNKLEVIMQLHLLIAQFLTWHVTFVIGT